MSAPFAVEDLHYAHLDGTVALRGVEVRVEAGERVAILGANGAGKTTLALHLNGLLTPDRGRVLLDGQDIADTDLVEVRRRVQLVFQDPNDQLFLATVHDDVAFGPANLGLDPVEREDRVLHALEMVDATHLAARPPHHLSGGEKRRVALATALAMHPDVLVLDEPTAGLDPAGTRDLVPVLHRLDQTQLLITHDLPFAMEACERAVVLAEGVVVEDGPITDVLSAPGLRERTGLALPFGFDPVAARAMRA